MAQVGIDLLCLAEGAARFGMVEAVGQPQSLVEVALGLGRCRRDRIADGAEIVQSGTLERSS